MLIQNNTHINNKPSFKAIKSIKCTGLYQNEPELSKELIDTFKTNKEAMEFCKKYDVDIIFHARQQSPADATESTIIINYIDPTKSKLKRFFDTLNGIKNSIQLHAWGTGYFEKESLKSATKELNDIMISSTDGKPVSGVLTAHIQYAEKDISERIAKKEKIIKEKEAKQNKKQEEINEKEKASVDLNKSIEELINATK